MKVDRLLRSNFLTSILFDFMQSRMLVTNLLWWTKSSIDYRLFKRTSGFMLSTLSSKSLIRLLWNN